MPGDSEEGMAGRTPSPATSTGAGGGRSRGGGAAGELARWQRLRVRSIRRKLAEVRAAEIPVVVSMGSVPPPEVTGSPQRQTRFGRTHHYYGQYWRVQCFSDD